MSKFLTTLFEGVEVECLIENSGKYRKTTDTMMTALLREVSDKEERQRILDEVKALQAAGVCPVVSLSVQIDVGVLPTPF